MIKLEFVVPRLDVMTSQNIYAIVKAELQSEEDFSEVIAREMLRERVTKAVNAWELACRRGREALEDSSFDFNLGDLSNYLSDEFAPGYGHRSKPEWEVDDLERYLIEQGVTSLSINITFNNCDDWHYDTCLSYLTEDDF